MVDKKDRKVEESSEQLQIDLQLLDLNQKQMEIQREIRNLNKMKANQ
jgi:hypothetical protein